MAHSGRQYGGAPSIPVKQEQTGLKSTTLHSAFGPHGEGTHGLIGGLIGLISKKKKNHYYSVYFILTWYFFKDFLLLFLKVVFPLVYVFLLFYCNSY